MADLPGSDSPLWNPLDLDASLLRVLTERLSTGVLVTDTAQERVLYANPAFARLWGLELTGSLAAVAGEMALRAADPRLVDQLWSRVRQSAEGGPEPASYLLLRDGREVRWSTHYAATAEGCSQVHFFEELFSRRLEPERGSAGADLFRLTFEKAAVGMALISSDYRFLRTNPSLCRMTGYTEADLLALRVADLTHPEERTQEEDWAEQLQGGQESFHLDRRFRRADGQPLWFHLSVSVVADAMGRPVYFVAMAEDITERKLEEEEQARLTQELANLATTDPLTGVYNHRFMQDFLTHRLLEAKRTDQTVSILMLDVDHFRLLNDEFGHDVGDRALRAVAECLRHSLREQDVACRYGGEEFVMILAGAPFASAVAAAERVRRRVEAQCGVGAGDRPITCSIGVASYPEHASTTASLLKAADVALYQAKREGRNRVCGYRPVPVEVGPDHLQKLGAALQGGSLDAVNALVTAIDLRDRFTGAHCQRVGRIAVELSERLGCSPAEIQILRLGAQLLDVGKIGLSDDLLTKEGTLTRDEWETMRKHPEWGAQLVLRSSLPPAVAELARWHHERLDGSGYPDGLQGDQIPLLVRIVMVADVATALREDRPHRRAWPRDRVIGYLRRQAGKKLDADVVRAYCELYERPIDPSARKA